MAISKIKITTDGVETREDQTGETVGDKNAGHVSVVGSENHIGEVGGNSEIFRLNPTIDTNEYASEDVIGGLQTLTNAMRVNAGKGILTGMVVNVASNSVHPPLEVILFDSNPTSSTTGNNNTLAIHADDVSKRLASFTIGTSDYALTGGVYRAKSGDPIQILKSGAASKDLYVVIVAKAAVTFARATDLHVKLDIMRD